MVIVESDQRRRSSPILSHFADSRGFDRPSEDGLRGGVLLRSRPSSSHWILETLAGVEKFEALEHPDFAFDFGASKLSAEGSWWTHCSVSDRLGGLFDVFSDSDALSVVRSSMILAGLCLSLPDEWDLGDLKSG